MIFYAFSTFIFNTLREKREMIISKNLKHKNEHVELVDELPPLLFKTTKCVDIFIRPT